MHREIPYVIRPKDNLLDAIKPYMMLGFYFSKPIIWTVPHGGRPILPLHDREITLKLLFLAYFRSRAIETKSDDTIKFVNEMFGEEPFHLTIFDHWWTLEKTVGPQKIYDVEDQISPDEIKKLSKTGNSMIDSYIDSLLQEPDDDDE